MAFQEGSTEGELTGQSYRTLVPAPSGSNNRVVKLLHILNRDTTDVGLELFLNNGGTRTQITKTTLATYQAFEWPSTLVLNSATKSIEARLLAAPAVSQPSFITTYADTPVSSGSQVAPANAPFLVTTYSADLSAERVINPVGPLIGVDGGANGAYDVKMDIGVLPTQGSPGDNDLIYLQEAVTGTQYKVLKSALAGSSVSITSGAYASLPASGTNTGDTYYCTDSMYTFVWDGSAWDAYWGSHPVTVPPSTGWSWDNQGSATLDITKGIHQLAEDVQGNVVNYRVRYRNIPTAPYTVTALLQFSMPPINYRNAGICLRQSSDGKIITFRLQWNGAWRVAVVKHADSATDTAAYTDITNAGDMLIPYAWLRIEDDNTNLYFHVSGDGLNFNYLYSVARTDYLTADGVGFFVSARDNTSVNGGAAVTLVSWEEG